jgi:hypothetical protein
VYLHFHKRLNRTKQPLSSAPQILMGLGTAVLDSAQHKMFYHVGQIKFSGWFGIPDQQSGCPLAQSAFQAILHSAETLNIRLLQYFGFSGLALAFALESSVARVVSLTSGMTTIPIRDQTGWYGWTLWISVVLCGFSLAVNLLYVYGERKFVPSKYRLSEARSRAIAGKKGKFQYRQLFNLPWCFWMLPMTQLLQSEAAGAFGNSATDLITMKGYEVR